MRNPQADRPRGYRMICHGASTVRWRLPYNDAVQLELFSPDRTALAEGWETVERLDLARARRVFEDVLDRWPETEEATEALRWLTVAEERLDGMEGDAPRELITRLWNARDAFPRQGLGGRFREAVLARLLSEMQVRGLGGPTDAPCQGEALLEAGRPGAAVRWLTRAVAVPGCRKDLRRILGLAFWASERPKEARRHWLAWLLTFDEEEAARAAASVPAPEIPRLVAAHGAASAPVWAWLEGLAPLLKDDELPGRRTEALELHRHVLAAEEARRRGDLDEAITHREALLRLDPELLRRYMHRLG